MNILVVNGHSLHQRVDLPGLFRRHDPGAEVTMICSAKHGYGSARNYESYRRVYTIEDFETNPEVERIARRVCRAGVDRIVAGNERDVLTVARLRAHFGLPGQTIEQALRFRDKTLMKEAARGKGFAVADFQPLHNVQDAYGFAERHGFPLLLKPRRGASSFGISVVHIERELTAALGQILRRSGLNRDSELEFQLETLVEGRMFSVNGFVMSGAAPVVWPNRVDGSWLALAQRGEPVFDYIMEPEAPESGALVAYARGLLAGLGLDDGVFHLEVFERASDGELLLCEVACRTPGLLIADAWKKMFGLDLDEISFLLQTGLASGELAALAAEFDPARRLCPAVGYLSIPCRNGLVVRAPAPAMDGVAFEKFVLAGSQYSHNEQINSLALLALLEADTRENLLAKCEALKKWYFTEVIWEE